MSNISFEHRKVIWFKKAKCAGTSFESVMQKAGVIYYVDGTTTLEELENPDNKVICIREALFPYGGTPTRMPSDEYKILYKSPIQFRIRRFLGCPFEPKQFMLKHFPDFLNMYPKFAVVRNPFDKFISSWKYLKNIKEKNIDEVINKLPTRREFHDWIHITQQQADCVRSNHGKLLVDQVIYMESKFDDDINDILEYIGIESIKMPVKNKSARSDCLQYLTPEIIRKIIKLYNDDFKIFGYSTDAGNMAPIKKYAGIHLHS